MYKFVLCAQTKRKALRERSDEMLLIVKVQPMSEYLVKVDFNNGNSLILNLENKIKTIRFQQLKDTELFEKVTTDGYCIHFNDFIEISTTELFNIAQSI